MSPDEPRPELVRTGPHGFFSDQHPVAPSQHRDVATLVAALFDIPYETRYDAATFEVRLRAALVDKMAGGRAPALKEDW